LRRIQRQHDRATLILIGELDDWTLAESCRNMVEGRDDWEYRGRRPKALRSG